MTLLLWLLKSFSFPESAVSYQKKHATSLELSFHFFTFFLFFSGILTTEKSRMHIVSFNNNIKAELYSFYSRFPSVSSNSILLLYCEVRMAILWFFLHLLLMKKSDINLSCQTNSAILYCLMHPHGLNCFFLKKSNSAGSDVNVLPRHISLFGMRVQLE